MSRHREQGAALLLLLAVLALGGLWYIVSGVQSRSADFTAASRAKNAQVLNQAKQALIGYVAAQAAKSGEDNPGALPCPEHSWYIDYADKEGGAGPAIGTPSPGYGTANCSSIGRFPWRTIGTDKLVDAGGQPLWYVVGPTWRKTSTSTKTVINSNTVGDLTVNGQNAVALIIAPGTAMNVAAGTTTSGVACAARTQMRAAPASSINPLDYLECYDATMLAFSSSGPAGSFNDQVVAITAADLLPGIEAAVADRFEREIAPVLKTVYAAPSWGLTGSSVIYPFAAPFGDPSTSSMQGAAATYRGLLPVNYAETSPGSGVLCTSGSTPRCSPSFVAWSGTPTLSGSAIYSADCSTTTATSANCTFYYRCPLLSCVLGVGSDVLSFTLTGTAANVGMALRRINTSAPMTNVDAAGRNASGVMNTDGSATITLTGTTTVNYTTSFVGNALCGISGLLSLTLGCQQASLAVPIVLLADHSILDSSSSSSTGWFLRNKWHEVSYYAVAAGYAPGVLPTQPSCASGCLSIANVAPAGQDRALLIVAGRSLNGTARPSSLAANYVEFGNATGSFERQLVSTANVPGLKKPFNDRVVVIDCSNPNVAFTRPCDNR